MATDNSSSAQLSSATALFDRPQSGERAVLVHVNFSNLDSSDELSELESLAVSAGADPVSIVTANRKVPDARIFVGKGKLAQIHDIVHETSADLVIFNHELSPSQERNIEKELGCRVLDRAGLILDIFAQRARTFEGKLQVELAQLRHISTRLIRGWTHLERQKGGIGLRGPGETQLETDRRLLAIRIKQLKKKLEKVRSQREQGRQSRKKNDIPTVALVGYTNAGKSTLFNYITESEVYAADQLFATLDPTLRKLDLFENRSLILADTVGFINHLPHELVAAFRATLEETCEADLILHVVDSDDELRNDRIDQVNQVLESIGAESVPQIMVMNKCDLTDVVPRVDAPGIDSGNENLTVVWLSAKTGNGVGLLKEVLTDHFSGDLVEGTIEIAPHNGVIRARLYSFGAVLDESIDEKGFSILKVSLSQKHYSQLCKEVGSDIAVIS